MPVFFLTEEHVKLMQGLHFYYENGYKYGAPAVDAKRPFGNSGRHQIVMDMAKILGISMDKVYDDEKEELIESESVRIEKIYRELPRAIECVLRTLSFDPGVFDAPAYTVDWKRAEYP